MQSALVAREATDTRGLSAAGEQQPGSQHRRQQGEPTPEGVDARRGTHSAGAAEADHLHGRDGVDDNLGELVLREAVREQETCPVRQVPRERERLPAP